MTKTVSDGALNLYVQPLTSASHIVVSACDDCLNQVHLALQRCLANVKEVLFILVFVAFLIQLSDCQTLLTFMSFRARKLGCLNYIVMSRGVPDFSRHRITTLCRLPGKGDYNAVKVSFWKSQDERKLSCLV